MAINFSDVLDKKVGDVERPPLLPVGLYRARVSKVPSMDTIADGRFDVCDFNLQIVEPVEVDEDDLKEFKGDVKGSNVRHRFMFSTEDEAWFDRSLYDLRRFLEQHLACADEDTALKEGLNNSVNCECQVQIRHRPDQNNPEVKYVEVARTAPLDD